METLQSVTERAILDARAIAGSGRMVTTEPQQLPCGRRRLADIAAAAMREGDDLLPVAELARRIAPVIESAMFDD
jgi:hypothetical protein